MSSKFTPSGLLLVTSRVVSTVQIGNYAILEHSENADHLAGTKIFENQQFTTVESILPDRPIRKGSQIGGLRQNLVCPFVCPQKRHIAVALVFPPS